MIRTGRAAQTDAEPSGTAPVRESWAECNQRYLQCALEAVLERLGPGGSDARRSRAELEARLGAIASGMLPAPVHDEWGFAAKSERGLGTSALFSGPSGTGKTLAAEVLANELGLDLFRVDLSRVVSKYIGETEKNLGRVFDAADAGGAMLLFDEADALFGKRSEVRDSHDRYANIEVGYLLTRMEAYRGVALLATNVKQALDQAFLRRPRFSVAFPFPNALLRAQIWRRTLPAAAPVGRLDFEKLARLDVTDGTIRNIALDAAFSAAVRDEPLDMADLLEAARRECAKLEKPLGAGELGGWV